MIPRSWAVPLLLLSLARPATCLAQHETDNWYFGDHAAIHFVPGGPVAVTNSAMNTLEGCSSISDPITGQLLFYTDATTVYNRNHVVMQNGTGLMGGLTPTQGALIVQHPGNPNLYYIFTVNGLSDPPNFPGCLCFKYSLVDMSAQGGLGAVTATKNVTLIASDMTEKLCAVRASNGVDVWVMVRHMSINRLEAFKVTTSGLVTTPVVSNVGGAFTFFDFQGQMKFSPDGHRLALARGSNSIVELYDFDNSTGVVSNARLSPSSLLNNARTYGLEFSPNSNRLYVSGLVESSLPDGSGVFQFDLTAATPAAIWASKTPVGPQSTFRALASLQLGPDGKIYVAHEDNTSLHVINNPDGLGAACNFVANALYLGGNSSQYGLPTAIARQPVVLPIELAAFSARCQGDHKVVDWITATEHDNDHFVVERSTDGVQWQQAAVLAGAGNSAHALHYDWEDRSAPATAYYRLRQVDGDGVSTVSGVVAAACMQNSGHLVLRPDDGTTGVLTVLLPGDQLFTDVDVIGADGRLERSVRTNGQQQCEVPLSGLADGIYLVRARSATSALVERWAYVHY